MKRLHLFILAILAGFCGLCTFSYVSALESGETAPFLLVFAALSGVATFFFARRWEKNGKLPESITDHKNDLA